MNPAVSCPGWGLCLWVAEARNGVRWSRAEHGMSVRITGQRGFGCLPEWRGHELHRKELCQVTWSDCIATSLIAPGAKSGLRRTWQPHCFLSTRSCSPRLSHSAALGGHVVPASPMFWSLHCNWGFPFTAVSIGFSGPLGIYHRVPYLSCSSDSLSLLSLHSKPGSYRWHDTTRSASSVRYSLPLGLQLISCADSGGTLSSCSSAVLEASLPRCWSLSVTAAASAPAKHHLFQSCLYQQPSPFSLGSTPFMVSGYNPIEVGFLARIPHGWSPDQLLMELFPTGVF